MSTASHIGGSTAGTTAAATRAPASGVTSASAASAAAAADAADTTAGCGCGRTPARGKGDKPPLYASSSASPSKKILLHAHFLAVPRSGRCRCGRRAAPHAFHLAHPPPRPPGATAAAPRPRPPPPAQHPLVDAAATAPAITAPAPRRCRHRPHQHSTRSPTLPPPPPPAQHPLADAAGSAGGQLPPPPTQHVHRPARRWRLRRHYGRHRPSQRSTRSPTLPVQPAYSSPRLPPSTSTATPVRGVSGETIAATAADSAAPGTGTTAAPASMERPLRPSTRPPAVAAAAPQPRGR